MQTEMKFNIFNIIRDFSNMYIFLPGIEDTSVEIRQSWDDLVKCVYKGLYDDKSSVVKVVAWHLFGAKPLPEPMLTEGPK